MNNLVLGLDIGGANIKYCFSSGETGSVPFELWRHPNLLSQKLQGIPGWNWAQEIAVTMTGELADCFEMKSAGVESICLSVQEAVGQKEVCFYQIDGSFVDAGTAITNWQQIAASNWHALASLVGEVLPDCLVVDIGSTTTDVIPVKNRMAAATGKNDLTRLAAGELLYTGVIRSPVCAVVQAVNVNGNQIPVAQELFANMLDVYVILDQIPESELCQHTCDGRAASKVNSRHRMARMLCAEVHELGDAELLSIAQQVASQQKMMIRGAIERMSKLHSIRSIAVVGQGAFLAKRVFDTALDDFQVFYNEDLIGIFKSCRWLRCINTASAITCLFQLRLSQTAI